MLRELEAAGIDTRDFGLFTSLRPTTFDYARAAPILIEWLPRMVEPAVVDSIARSLTGQPAARGEGSRRLISAFLLMSPGRRGRRRVGHRQCPRDRRRDLVMLTTSSSWSGPPAWLRAPDAL